MDIKELATQLDRALIWKERGEKKIIVRADKSPEWMQDVIHKVHGDKMPDDTVYEMISRAASALAECSGDSYDDLREAIKEIEADIYTSDLTGWLGARADHIGYLDEALTEYDHFHGNGGFDLLQAAQHLQIEEIGAALLDALKELAENWEEEETEEE